MQDSPLLGDDDHADDDAVEGAAERLEQRGLGLVVERSGLAPLAIRFAGDTVRCNRHRLVSWPTRVGVDERRHPPRSPSLQNLRACQGIMSLFADCRCGNCHTPRRSAAGNSSKAPSSSGLFGIFDWRDLVYVRHSRDEDPWRSLKPSNGITR
jgi:hypothetical protein